MSTILSRRMRDDLEPCCGSIVTTRGLGSCTAFCAMALRLAQCQRWMARPAISNSQSHPFSHPLPSSDERLQAKLLILFGCPPGIH